MTLEEAWAEFRETAQESGIHVSMLEAHQMLSGAEGETSQLRRQAPLTAEQEDQGRFLDWLLYVKKEKALAYELLQRVGTVTVGPRQYWASRQGERRAIAWESRYTYPDSDSEVWDLIFVDETC
jgi:hypothetical protein